MCKKKYFLWGPVILWMGFIFCLSSVPGNEIPDLHIPNFHPLVHFVEYSVLTILLLRAFKGEYPDINAFRQIVSTILVVIIFAVTDEWHQTFVAGRSGKLPDAVTDTVYSIIAMLFYFKVIIKRRQG